MRKEYEIALHFFDPVAISSLTDGENNVDYSYDEQDEFGNDIPDYFRVFSKFSYKDPMDIEPESGSSGHNVQVNPLQVLLSAYGFPIPLDSEDVHYTYDAFQNALSSVTKAMMTALLEDNGKRTTTLASRTLEEQKEIFYNALSDKQFRDNTALPWSMWRDSHSTLNISSVERSNNYAIFTVSGAHNLSPSYDDWGAIINIDDTSFNTHENKYNGDSIILNSATQFSIYNEGPNVTTKSVTGTADIRIGWGGSSINLHQYSG